MGIKVTYSGSVEKAREDFNKRLAKESKNGSFVGSIGKDVERK